MRSFKIANDYSVSLHDVYDKAPKAVIAAVAVSILTTGGERLYEARELFLKEWAALHMAGIVPQSPPKQKTASGIKHLAFLLPLLLLASACRKKEDAPPTDVPHVAGTWSGTGTDDAIGYFNLSVDLTQSVDSAAGTFTMAGQVATVTGDVSMAIGPQGGNNLRAMTLLRKSWTVADPANANRVCAATLTVRPGSSITGSSFTFSYTMTDCQNGTWTGGANLHKIAGTN